MLVSTSNPAPGAVTSLATIMSRFFFCSLAAAFFSTSLVSAAKPTSTWPGRFSRPTCAATSGFWRRVSTKSPSPCFLIFCSATVAGAKSAGAAAWITMSVSGQRAVMASYKSWVDRIFTASTPSGTLRLTGPVTSVTLAPRFAAASAMA